MNSDGQIYWRCSKCGRDSQAGRDCWCGEKDTSEQDLSERFQSLLDMVPKRSMDDVKREFEKKLRADGKDMGLK